SALLFTQLNQTGTITLENSQLELTKGQNIALFGRGSNSPGVELKNSTINVIDGNIRLGAVNGKAKIILQADWQPEFPSTITLGDIHLTAGAKVSANSQNNAGNTAIWIDTNNLKIAESAKISTLTTDTEKGANITINARESVTITGEDSNAFQAFVFENLVSGGNANLSNGLETTTLGMGNAGNIEITTPKLIIDNGAGIVSATRNQGKSGSINLNIFESMRLKGSGLLTGSGAFTSGNVGEINIDTQELIVEQNSAISSSTLGAGNAGNLSIHASKVIEIKDTFDNAIVPNGIFTNTIFQDGDGGNLQINTPRLIVLNGGQLSASSGAIFINNDGGLDFIRSGGKGGDIDLKVDQSLEIVGVSTDGKFPSSILSETRTSNPAGNVKIQTGDVNINSEGLISASSLGNGVGGNIEIDANNSVNIDGAGVDSLQSLIVNGLQGQLNRADVKGGIAAFSIDDGEAGSVTINTNSLNLDVGAVVSTATYGDYDAGHLTINASEEINVRSSAIITPTFGAGDGGDINLSTKNLNITNGGGVVSASSNSGQAGNVNILATESISILDVIPRLPFSGSISSGNYRGEGLSGNLTINTQRLSIKNGAYIETNNVFFDVVQTGILFNSRELGTSPDRIPGKLLINATESIEISGSVAEATSFNLFPNSHIHSITNTFNPASNVEINTGKLLVNNGGEISVSSFGFGAAGTLAINADSVTLKDRGHLNGTTVSGQGGNIDLQVASLLKIDDHSEIDTNASQGNGGNINITADFVIASSGSSIAANALLDGNGGNINIMAKDIFLTADSSVTANSALGLDGTVRMETLLDIQRNNLTRLPQQVIQADNRITKSCSNGDRQGIFSYIGRGGMPVNPLTNFQTAQTLIADLDIPAPVEMSNKIQLKANSQLELLEPQAVEAERWQINAQGKVELTAASNNSTTPHFNSHCPLIN
ncbi:MAG: hypothetical protein AAFO95_18845, partial [Cyanobacteria bacterium J06600_6]